MSHSKSAVAVLKANTLSKLRIGFCFIVAILAMAIVASASFGQDDEDEKKYNMIPILGAFADTYGEVDEDETKVQQAAQKKKIKDANAKIKENVNLMKDYMSGKVQYGAVSNRFDRFFKEYVFHKMTDWETQGNLAELGKLREEFVKTYMSAAAGRNQRQRLINTVLNISKEIVESKENNGYHPAVRLNAIVLLGMMNERDGEKRTSTFPIPSQPALGYLATVFSDQKFEPFLKVGAIAGIMRHLQVERAANGQLLDTAVRNSIVNQCMAIVNDTATDQDKWDEGVSYWLKRRSIQALGAMGKPGANDVVVDTVMKLIKDDSAPYWLRFDALNSIGQLELQTVNKQKFVGTSYSVVEFMAKTLEHEASSIEQDVKDLLISNVLYKDVNLLRVGTKKKKNKGDDMNKGAGGLDGGDQGGGGGGGDKKKEKPKVELPTYYLNAKRQRVKSIVYITRKVLRKSESGYGLETVLNPEEVKFLNDLNEEFDKILKASDIGVKDVGLKQEEQDKLDENPLSYTQRMANVFRRSSKDIMKLVRKSRGDPEPKEGAKDPADKAAKPAEKPLEKKAAEEDEEDF